MTTQRKSPKTETSECNESSLEQVLLSKVAKLSDLSDISEQQLDDAYSAINPTKALDKAGATAFMGIAQFREVEQELENIEDEWAQKAQHSARQHASKCALVTKLGVERATLYPEFEKMFKAQLESAGDRRDTMLFAIWDSDINGISEETIRGKAFKLFMMQDLSFLNLSDEGAFRWSYFANQREQIRKLHEPYQREALRPKFEEAYQQSEEDTELPTWKRLAIERFESSGFTELKEYAFELFFQEFEDTIQSMEVPLPEIPALYETEDIPLDEKIIYVHFFIRDTHWFVAEHDPEKGLFFGYAILNGELQMAEWGYSSLDEMLGTDIHGLKVERDLSWEAKKFGEIDLDAMGKF